jgi:hypothetical protein
VILQSDRFPPKISVILLEPTAKIRLFSRRRRMNPD